MRQYSMEPWLWIVWLNRMTYKPIQIGHQYFFSMWSLSIFLWYIFFYSLFNHYPQEGILVTLGFCFTNQEYEEWGIGFCVNTSYLLFKKFSSVKLLGLKTLSTSLWQETIMLFAKVAALCYIPAGSFEELDILNSNNWWWATDSLWVGTQHKNLRV